MPPGRGQRGRNSKPSSPPRRRGASLGWKRRFVSPMHAVHSRIRPEVEPNHLRAKTTDDTMNIASRWSCSNLTRSPSLYPSTLIVRSVRHKKDKLAPYAIMPKSPTNLNRTPTIVALPSFGPASSVPIDPNILGADESAFDPLPLDYPAAIHSSLRRDKVATSLVARRNTVDSPSFEVQ